MEFSSICLLVVQFSLGEYEEIVERWSLVVQYMSVSSIIYSVLPRRV